MKALPKHLLITSDGALYDTRKDGWAARPPLRPVYSRHFRAISTVAELKATLRAGAYAWPGGYPMYFVTTDGAALSFEAVRGNLRWCVWSLDNDCNDGWQICACDINYEDAGLFCDHTGERIESAYAEDEVTP